METLYVRLDIVFTTDFTWTFLAGTQMLKCVQKCEF